MDVVDREDGKDVHEEPAQATAGQATEGQDADGGDGLVKRKTRKTRRAKVTPTGSAGLAGRAPASTPLEDSPKRYMHFFHFNAQTGKVTYIDDKNPFGEVCECHKCGTAMQYETEKCPVCGTRFDEGDCGIVALLGKSCPGWPCPPEMDCPQCGEHIKLVNGACPKCEAPIMPSGKTAPDERADKLVSVENVVFVHLDVESGEVEYLQRLEGNRGFGHTAVQLKESGPDGSAEG